jgi:hypothetical protein
LKNEVGFRFVRHTKKKGRVELSDKEIQAKIGHALRDLSATLRESTNIAAKKKEKLPEKPASPFKPPAMVTPQAPERVVSDDNVSLNGIKIPACPNLKNMKKGKSKKKISEEAFEPSFVTPQRGNTSLFLPVPERDTSLFLPVPDTEEDLQDMAKVITAPSKKKIKKRPLRAPKIPSVISSSSLISPHEEKAIKFSKLEAAVSQIANSYDNKDIKDDDGDDDDYSFTPLRFDDSSQNGILETVPMEFLPVFANENVTSLSRTTSLPIISKGEGSNFDYVLGLNDEVGTSTTDDTRGGFRKFNSFSEFHFSHQKDYMDDQSSQRSYGAMSMSSHDDDAMIEKSLCDSIDCLSLDLDCV